MSSKSWPYEDNGGNVDDQASSTSSGVVETDLLIIGAGPAGASLACFLAQHGQFSMIICTDFTVLIMNIRPPRYDASRDTGHCRYS
jgi:glycine/D-amino acid oxidase-like deaminating enzyme